MPWAAAMSSTIKVSSRAFTQAATGEWIPPTVTWSSITGVPCRIFPASESDVQRIWGEALRMDAICWVSPADVTGLAVQTLTTGSGAALPVQVTDSAGNTVPYMAISARNLANQGKLLAIALKRWSHG